MCSAYVAGYTFHCVTQEWAKTKSSICLVPPPDIPSLVVDSRKNKIKQKNKTKQKQKEKKKKIKPN